MLIEVYFHGFFFTILGSKSIRILSSSCVLCRCTRYFISSNKGYFLLRKWASCRKLDCCKGRDHKIYMRLKQYLFGCPIFAQQIRSVRDCIFFFLHNSSNNKSNECKMYLFAINLILLFLFQVGDLNLLSNSLDIKVN